MSSATEFCHHLSVRYTFFACRRLGLRNAKFLKQLNLSLEALIMVNAHHNKIALAIGRQIHRFIFLVTDARNFPRSVPQTRNGFNNWHICSLESDGAN